MKNSKFNQLVLQQALLYLADFMIAFMTLAFSVFLADLIVNEDCSEFPYWVASGIYWSISLFGRSCLVYIFKTSNIEPWDKEIFKFFKSLKSLIEQCFSLFKELKNALKK